VEGGFADDEFAADDDGVRRSGGGEAGQLVEEAAGCLFAHFFAGVVDRGKLGLHDPGDRIVVEADDGDVFGYFYSFFFQGLEEHGGEEVVGGEDAVGALVQCDELFCGADGGGFAEIVYDDEPGVEWKAIIGECLLVAFEAAGINVTGEIGGDMGDVAAALCGEMGGGFVAGANIVDDDAGAVGEILHPIEKNDGDAFFYEGIEVIHVGGVEGEGGDEAIDAFVEKVMGVGGFFAKGFGGVADDQMVTRVGRYFFDAGQDGADELAFELVDDDADGICLLHSQVGGEAVGSVAHFAGHVHDAFAGLYIDGWMVFKAAADGGGRKAEDLGNVVDGNIFFSGHK